MDKISLKKLNTEFKLLYMYENSGENNTINLKKVLYFNWINLDWFTIFVVNDILEKVSLCRHKMVKRPEGYNYLKGRNVKNEFSE